MTVRGIWSFQYYVHWSCSTTQSFTPRQFRVCAVFLHQTKFNCFVKYSIKEMRMPAFSLDNRHLVQSPSEISFNRLKRFELSQAVEIFKPKRRQLQFSFKFPN